MYERITSLKDKKLIQDCIEQKPKAQRQLFERYYVQMLRIAKRYVIDVYEAEDVLLIAFNKVFRSIHRFELREQNSLKRWITTIVINEALKSLRNRQPLNFPEELNDLQVDYEVPLSIQEMDVEQIMKIIEHMPKGYRTVFNLVAIEGYSHKESAEMLMITESTSRTQLKKARNYIIEKIKKDEYGAA